MKGKDWDHVGCGTCERREERSCPNRRCRCGAEYDDQCRLSPVYGVEGRCPKCWARRDGDCRCLTCGHRWRAPLGMVECPRCWGLYVAVAGLPEKKRKKV